MWVYFSFIWFIPIFDNKSPRRIPVQARGCSRQHVLSVLQGLLSSFRHKNSLQILNHQFHDFCTFLLSACKSLLSDGLNFILFKICIVITILDLSQKLRPFRNFSTLSKALCITSTTHASLYFLCSDSYWLLAAFHFQTLIFYILSPFIIHLNFNALSVLNFKRFRRFTSPSLVLCPFFSVLPWRV